MSSISNDEAIAQVIKLNQMLASAILELTVATKELANKLPPNERIIIDDMLIHTSKRISGHNAMLGELIEKLRAEPKNA